ncbi:MAG TPA: GNAT family N-acetyltransferase [Planctomycetaceae bacterium]|nr:GNAT family N-acetyltransferase [Planctomycetaceae bacterium]
MAIALALEHRLDHEPFPVLHLFDYCGQREAFRGFGFRSSGELLTLASRLREDDTRHGKVKKGHVLRETLETERLKLRQFVESDLDAYARICADPESMRHIGPGTPLSRAEAWRSIAQVLGHWELRGYGLWAAEEKRTGTFVGRIGLIYPEGWPAIEVGWLIDRDRWGEGFATEGGRAAMQFAFDRHNLEHISSVIRPQNAPSIRVAEKLGMRPERSMQLNGLDVVIYARDR